MIARQLAVAFRSPSGVAAVAVLGFLLAIAATAQIAGPSPLQQDLGSRLSGPSTAHVLGTDQLGRDTAARLSAAARGSVAVALAAALISGLAGGTIGLVSALAGRWLDAALQRVMDAMMVLPLLVLALAVVAASGPGRAGVIAAISVVFTPLVARITRGAALSLRNAAYVEAAAAMGAPRWSVISRHLVPNVAASWLVVVSGQFGGALIAEASLSFLGAGPPVSLGAMLGREAQTYMHASPWLVLWPGMALALIVLGVNLLADALAKAGRVA